MSSRFMIAVVVLTACTLSAQTELTNNGGFETGDFTDWNVLESSPGQTTIQTPGNGSMFSARINNTTLASASLLKNENLGVGTVMPGQMITISFDARGSTAVGGVAFAEFFSEIGGGGVSSSEILGGAPLALDANPAAWKSFSFTTTAGPDVTGGVTLQLAAITGGAGGSVADIEFDNCSVQIGTMPPATVELSVNGGFETGDFTAWQVFESSAGNTTIQTPGNGSMFSAQIDNQVLASASLIRNNNIGAGLVQPGDTVMVTFDARGTTAVGGVAFAEFFSEIAGGGVSSAAILGGAPLALDPNPAVWTTFSFTTPAGPDVTGGVTLQLAAITGGAPGSVSTIEFDNCSVTIPLPAATYPGSGEDIAISTGINGAPGGSDVKNALGGDVLQVTVESEGGTYDNFPYILLAQLVPTGSVGTVPGFPELHYDLTLPIFALVDPAVATPIGTAIILTGGSTTAYLLPAGLNGLGQSLILQGIVQDPFAANGIFASSDGNEVVIP